MNRIELVLVLLFTFFVIVVWITSDVILVKPNAPDDPKVKLMLEPLTPTFDSKTLEQVSNTKIDTPISQPSTPAPTPTPLPRTSPSPTPRAQPSIAPSPSTSTSSATLPFGNDQSTASTPLIGGSPP